ncbi:hypothetical protein P5673_012392 [Acropora cervicornis]|uniref:Uncharacterized protein n=1 Tax=Acropora cervicornis TaxID=6130 RepID=A0AAD9V7L6_ACRCE|nr:hypothetical protein P5673_012392 [Acropora cervicornis]
MSNTESKSDSNSQPGPSKKKKARKALSDSDDASDNSDCDAVHAIIGEDGQDGGSSDKLLKEIEEEYNTADKTDLNINENQANLINNRFAGKPKEAKLKARGVCTTRQLRKIESAPCEQGTIGKSQDFQITTVQQTVVKAIIALKEVTEKISQREDG